MVDPTTDELVLLHLDRGSPGVEDGPAASFRELAGVLDVSQEALGERVELLSALSGLERDGLVAERTVGDGEDEERVVYTLTDEGRAKSRAVREGLAGATVEVTTGNGHETVPLAEVHAEFGLQSPVAALARQDGDGVVRLDDGGPARFVNRTAELQAVEGLLSAVEEGDPRILLVSGAEGIGKTTFVEEAAEAARERGVDVYGGAGRADADIPYAPIREMLADADGVANPFDRETAAAEDDDAFETRRTDLFRDVVDAVERLAADRPSMFVVDDVHWTDDATLALAAHLVEHVDAPVLLVGAYRPEDMPDEHPLASLSPDDDRVTGVDLGPFDREATRGLVEYHVGSHDVPDHLVDIVHERTGGTPLFVVESVKRLVDDGLVDPNYDLYPEDPADIPIPDRVEAAIDIRLGVLDDEGERVLEAAAVAGDVASVALLDAVCDVDGARVREYLDLLVDSRVLDREGEDVRFASDVVRETVLERLSGERRRRLHERVADALLDLSEASDERAATVATHLEAAGDVGRAIEFYREAADDAMDVFAHELALENNRRALRLARDRGDDAAIRDLLLSIGRTHYLRSEYEDAERYFEYVRERTEGVEYMEATRHLVGVHVEWADYERALELAEDGLERWDGETPGEAACDLLARKAGALRNLGRLEESADTTRQQYDLAVDLGEDGLIARGYQSIGQVSLERGDLDDALAYAEAAQHHYEAAGNRWRLARVVNNAGIVHWRQGDLESAREAFGRAARIEAEVGNVSGHAGRLLNLGVVESRRGDFEAAVEQYELALEKATEVDVPRTRWLATGNIGVVRLKQGRLDAAEDRTRAAIGGFETTGNARSQAVFRVNLARILFAAGRLGEARELAETGLATARDDDIRTELSEAHRLLGAIAAETGDIETAMGHLGTALGVAEDVGSDPKLLCSTRNRLARTHLAAGNPEDALDPAREAAAAGDVSDPWWRMRATATLGACLRETGDLDAAEQHLESALETARGMGARLHEGAIRYDLGLLYRARSDDEHAGDALTEALDIARETGSGLLQRRALAALDEGKGS